jgi:5-methylcytosine-specific restriction endonuclease McrA
MWAKIMTRFLLLLFVATQSLADPLVDDRYTDHIKRDQRGHIVRRADVIAAFKKQHPCPVTGKTYGKCPGWSINHVIPLACFGKDAVSNMQWLPNEIKKCKENWCIDRFEREIYNKKSAEPC